MDLIPYLSTVILIATIATILLAVVSYAVFKLRDRRRRSASSDQPIFFHRYSPPDVGSGDALPKLTDS